MAMITPSTCLKASDPNLFVIPGLAARAPIDTESFPACVYNTGGMSPASTGGG